MFISLTVLVLLIHAQLMVFLTHDKMLPDTCGAEKDENEWTEPKLDSHYSNILKQG